MSDKNLLGSWIRRFLLEHLIGERNLARNTQVSYRDTLALLIPFATSKTRKRVEQLAIEHITPKVVRSFLAHLEQIRGCGISTRNQRRGRDSRPGTLHCYAQPRTHHLVHFDSERSFQKRIYGSDSLPGEAGNGCATRHPRSV